MKAAVFHQPGDITVDHVADPRIEEAGDVILRVIAKIQIMSTMVPMVI